MSYEQKNNEGSLFKNDQKEGKQPDYKGSVTVSGQQYWLSAWLNTTKDGKKYLSLKMKEKDLNKAAPKANQFSADEEAPF